MTSMKLSRITLQWFWSNLKRTCIYIVLCICSSKFITYAIFEQYVKMLMPENHELPKIQGSSEIIQPKPSSFADGETKAKRVSSRGTRTLVSWLLSGLISLYHVCPSGTQYLPVKCVSRWNFLLALFSLSFCSKVLAERASLVTGEKV